MTRSLALGFLVLVVALLGLAVAVSGPAVAEPVCGSDRECANWAVQNGVDPEADPYTAGKATGHQVGQTVPSCDHIDWSEVQPVDLNHDGYVDCGSDLELGA